MSIQPGDFIIEQRHPWNTSAVMECIWRVRWTDTNRLKFSGSGMSWHVSWFITIEEILTI